MNVVDSSAWLEYFADGPNADHFAEPIEDVEKLLVPVITLYEVFKRLRAQRDETIALRAMGQLLGGRLVEVDADLALTAADVSLELGLPLADSLILATARRHDAVVWTQDADFEGLPEVEYRPHGGVSS